MFAPNQSRFVFLVLLSFFLISSTVLLPDRPAITDDQKNVQALKADFVGNPTDGLAPLTVTFNDLSTEAVTWAWAFPGGSPASATGQGPHTVTYNTAGHYTVTLTVTGSGFVPITDIETKSEYIGKYRKSD